VSGFRVVGSATRAHAGFLELSELTVAGPEGEFTRAVVRHPGAVVVVPLVDDDVILVRQYRAAVGRSLLEVPAGKRDVAGEAPAATATRELEEEIGRRPGRLTKLCEFYNSPGFTDEYTHLYCATDLTRAVAPRWVSVEERAMSLEQVPLAATADLIETGELVDAKSIIGLMLTQQLLERGRAGQT
jgi:8-oxo-dGTP pyrophosphatase MutT (NUDIX family)